MKSFMYQMEGLAPELTTKHRNLRGKDYFNSKNIEKMTSNNKTNRTVEKKYGQNNGVTL